MMILVVWFQPKSRIPAWRDTSVILAVHLVNYKVHYLVDVIRQTWIRTHGHVCTKIYPELILRSGIPSFDLVTVCIYLRIIFGLIAVNSNFYQSARLEWKTRNENRNARFISCSKNSSKKNARRSWKRARKFRKLSSIRVKIHDTNKNKNYSLYRVALHSSFKT